MNKNLELIKSEINNLNILSKMNNIDEIIKRSSILIKKYPKIQIFYNFLGSSLEKKNLIYDAEIIYTKSLELDPKNSFALINLGRISRIINDLQKSEELLKKAIDIEPENLFAQLYYGDLKIDQNSFKEAIFIFEKIYKKNKDFQNIIMRLANTYSVIGEFKKAEEYLSLASKKNPKLFAADYRLSNIINYSEKKDHQKLILEKIKNQEFDKLNKHPLFFAIAKSYEDQKDYEEAFKYIELANKERNKLVIGNPLRYEEFFLDKNKEIFSNITFKENVNNDFYKKKLIFIVGLPRSGTTLLHQILSAHSETYGVGESIVLNVFFFKNLVKNDFLKNLKKENKINLESLKEISLKLGKNYDYFDFDVQDLAGVNANGVDLSPNSGTASDDITSLKASAVYTLTPEWELYGSAGQGLHSNDARGTTIHVDPSSGDAVDGVDPLVRSTGVEAGLRGFIDETLNASLSVWQLSLDSELLFVGDAGNTEASRASKRKGAEVALYYQLDHNWSIDLEYAYTDAEFTDAAPEGDHIPGAIKNVVQAGVSAHFDNGLFGSLRARHFGERPLVEDNSITSDASTVFNLRAGYKINNWVLQLDVLNLTDSDAHDIDYYYASRLSTDAQGTETDDIHYHVIEPRTLRATVMYRF